MEEHFFRFLGQRAPHDYYTRPPYYILSVLFLGMLPWTHILVSLFGSIKRLRALQLYLVIWITIFFVFFTISRCASSYYMLPCYPALSILIGLNINQSVKTKFIKGVFITFTVFAFIASLLMLFLKKDDPILIYGRPYVIMNIIFYGIFCVISFYHYIRQNLTHMIRYGFFMLAVFVFTSLVFFNTHEGAFSSRSIALELKKVYKTEDMVFMMTRYEDYSSFPFYLNQYVFLLERVQKDLDYGIKKEKEKKVFFKMDEFLKLAETKTVYLFLKDKDYRGNISLNRFWIFAKCEEKLLITNAKKIKN
ncbi:MAG: hypothetical protein N2596_06095 [Syntrophorhabdaceae bacterium]|nr:hypothetical protein [Syntrophorhabdaceae bacterium]